MFEIKGKKGTLTNVEQAEEVKENRGEEGADR